MQAVNDDLVKQALSANVRRYMQQRGWSQAQLARQSEESEMAISRVLNAKNVPSAGVIRRIASALGVSVDSLFVVSSSELVTSENS